MNVDDFRRIYEFDVWANGRIFDALARLDEGALTRDLRSSFPTIQATAGHLAGVEWIWLRRWKGESPTAAPPWYAGAPVPLLRRELDAIEEERARFLAMLGDEELPRPVSYRNLKGEPFSIPLADLLFHCANHSTYHRGQLTTLLRQAGATPPSTDFVLFAAR